VGRLNFIDRMIELYQRRGFEVTVSQEVGDAITGIALVARGFGVTLVPESVVRRSPWRACASSPWPTRPRPPWT
jgi:DNA-binding transcriptional LysR family regulator